MRMREGYGCGQYDVPNTLTRDHPTSAVFPLIGNGTRHQTLQNPLRSKLSLGLDVCVKGETETSATCDIDGGKFGLNMRKMGKGRERRVGEEEDRRRGMREGRETDGGGKEERREQRKTYRNHRPNNETTIIRSYLWQGGGKGQIACFGRRCGRNVIRC
jgi:hypothetical protein